MTRSATSRLRGKHPFIRITRHYNYNCYGVLVLIIVGILPFIGCFNKRHTNGFYRIDKLLVKRTFFANNAIKTEECFNNDTVANGYYKEFDPLGNLIVLFNFKNGIIDGHQSSYYSNGKIRTSNWYKNGIIDSTSVKYYENGNIDSKVEYRRGLKFGLQLDYYMDGKIKKYLFYDIQGHLIYKREYDEDSKCISDQGRPLIMVVADNYNLGVGDTLNTKIYVATPPDVGVGLYTGMSLKQDTLWQEIPIKDNIGRYSFCFKKRGLYTLVTKVIRLDNDSICLAIHHFKI